MAKSKKLYVKVLSTGLMGRRAPNRAMGQLPTKALRKIAVFRACRNQSWEDLVAMWKAHKVPGSPAQTLAWLASERIKGPHVALVAKRPSAKRIGRKPV